MPAEDAGSSYRQGVVWVVGMSAAAAGGAFLHYDLARSLPMIAKAAFILVVLLFLLAIWSGVNCLFWLFYKASEEEKLKKIEEARTQNAITTAEYDAKKTASQGEIDKGKKWRALYHGTLLWTFALAILLSSGLLVFGTFSSASTVDKDSNAGKMDKGTQKNNVIEPDADRFAIVQSAVHRTAHGKEAHTFLLDREKGSLWVMTCSKQGVVEFHRVRTLNIDGAPQDPAR